jgi:hypothetical protein
MKIKHARIAEALISGRKLAEIATAESVSIRQIYRIAGRPDVRRIVDQAARELARVAARVLLQNAHAAATALVAVGTDGSAPASARVAALTKVIELGQRAVEIDDLARRVEELEAAVRERAGEHPGGWPT